MPDDLKKNLLSSALGAYLVGRGFTYPHDHRVVALEWAIKRSLGPLSSIGAAVVNQDGRLEPAASGEGLGWGHNAWDALERSPVIDNAMGIVVRYHADGHEWRWGINLRTVTVAPIPRIYKAWRV